MIPNSFYEEEDRTIRVSARVKRLWAVLLDLLVEFDRVCAKHGIKYVADGGTLLGAVRHGGFIPWDDDIDLIMKRSEYERLCSVAHEFKRPYFFQNKDTDLMALRGHAQFRNSDTTGILKGETENGRPLYSFNQGIFIDIFVMDNVPDDDGEAEAFMAELAERKERLFRVRSNMRPLTLSALRRLVRHPSALCEFAYQRIYDAFHKEPLLKKMADGFDEAAKRYDGTKTKRFSHLTFMPHPPKKFLFDSAILDELKRHAFEMVSVPVPVRAEEYLSQDYGDWREHVVGTSLHGGLIVDTERPYTEYLTR